MLVLWIIGLLFIGGGGGAVLLAAMELETPFGISLFGGGLNFMAAGFVISALGLVTRQIGRLQKVLDADSGTTEALAAIATTTLERPSLIGSTGTVERDKSSERSRPSAPAQPTMFPSLVRSSPSANEPRRVPRSGGAEQARADIGRSSNVERHDRQQASASVYSGTINDMRYELRADGTILAILPGHKLQFASMDDLRGYLAALPHDGASGNASVP